MTSVTLCWHHTTLLYCGSDCWMNSSQIIGYHKMRHWISQNETFSNHWISQMRQSQIIGYSITVQCSDGGIVLNTIPTDPDTSSPFSWGPPLNTRRPDAHSVLPAATETECHSYLGYSLQARHHFVSCRHITLTIQWNLSNTDSLGPIKCVLIREVSTLVSGGKQYLFIWSWDLVKCPD